jgi:hypothetical protein
MATPIRRNERAIVAKAGTIRKRGKYVGWRTEIANIVELPRSAIVATAGLKDLPLSFSLDECQKLSENRIKLANQPISESDPN